MAWSLTKPNGDTMTQSGATQGLTLGEIQSEEVDKSATLTISPLVFNDSGNTDVIDFGGAVRTIDVTGIMKDTSTNLATNKTALNGLIQGNQDLSAGYPLTYVSDIEGTVKVKISRVRSTHLGGAPRRLAYIISMVESSVNG